MACELFDSISGNPLELRERIGTWGDDAPAYYLTASGILPDLRQRALRLMGPDGVIITVPGPIPSRPSYL